MKETRSNKSLLKRAFSLLLSTVMLLSVFSANIFSAKAFASSGKCGANATYTFESGLLTIKGTGKTYNYESEPSPFLGQDDIEKIVVEKGITGLSDSLFAYCSNLKELALSDTVTALGDFLCIECENLSKVTLPASVKTVGDYPFGGCSKLNTVGPIGGGYNIEYGWTTEMPDEAFCGIEKITKLVVPKTMTNISSNYPFDYENIKTAGRIGSGCDFEFAWDKKIPSYAFCVMDSIETITVPNGITEAEYGAFAECDNLKKIYIPKTLTDLGGSLFYGNKNIKTAGKTGSGCDYEFAWEKTIPSNAFCELENLTEVTIPSGIESIGYGAFYNCNNLSHITIPDSVKKMDFPFYYCDSIETAGAIGSGCNYEYGWEKEVPENAFANLTKLRKLTVSKDITIMPYAITNCTDLKTAGKIGSGCDFEFGWDTLFPENVFSSSSLEEVILPNGVNAISDDMFYNCGSLKKVNMPKSIRKIGDYAFSESGLTSFVVPDTVISMGKGVFNHCEELTSVTLPGSVGYIPERTFEFCSNLSTLKINEGIKGVGNFAFTSCEKLKSIRLPEGCDLLAGCSFSAFSGLESISVPESMNDFAPDPTDGYDSFYGCEKLKTIIYRGSKAKWNKGHANGYGKKALSKMTVKCVGNDSKAKKGKYKNFEYTQKDNEILITKYNGKANSLTIPSKINGKKVVSVDGFAYNDYLNSIKLPTYLEKIDSDAFLQCKNLTNVTIPKSTRVIGDGAFQWCSNLSKITIPEGVIKIESGAFDGTAIQSVVLPKSLIELDSLAFSGSLLTSISIASGNKFYNIPNGSNAVVDTVNNNLALGCVNTVIPSTVKGIKDYAFCKCDKLRTIIIPEGVESIGYRTFYDCAKLETAAIPSSVCNIDDFVFDECPNFSEVYYSGTEKQWKETTKNMAKDWNKNLFNSDIHYNYNSEKTHIHQYNAKITKNATCKSKGNMKYTCGCKKSFNVALPKTSHIYIAKVVAPKTTALGYTKQICKVCGDYYVDDFTAPTGKVKGLKCTKRTSSSLNVKWNKVKGATHYDVQVSDSKGKKWKSASLYYSDSNKYVIKGLKAGSNYKVRVRFWAFNKEYSESASSSWVTINVPTKPGKIIIKELSAAKKAFTVKWNKKASVSGYQIKCSTDKSFKKSSKTITVNKKSTTSKKVTGLKSKKQYYVKIRTYKKIGDKKYYSSWSSVKSVETK